MKLFPVLTAGTYFLASTWISTALETKDLENLNSSIPILRRNAQIEARLATTPIYGVRKMSTDEGQKFFLDYWQFEDPSAPGSLDMPLADRDSDTTETQIGNSTIRNDSDAVSRSNDGSVNANIPDHHGEYMDVEIFAHAQQVRARSVPLTPSLELESASGAGLKRSSLEARDFKCPTGTNACTSIDRSDRCCSTGDTCVVVTDTGSGVVGCCPTGQSCSGMIGSCQNGYASCSQALGGGCCIPGYECVEGGCAYISVVTITIDSSVTVSTVTHTTSQQTSSIISTSSESSTSRSSSSSSSSPSPSSTRSTSTSTESLIPPARGTSITTTTHSSSTRADTCPTGFYACSAIYHGGCCQTNRNCDTTSCPPTSSTTLTSDGKTIVVPAPTTTGLGSSEGTAGSSTGQCAGGWFSCADTAGGGCCPSGYACGPSICTATGSGGTSVAKAEPTSNGSGVYRVELMLLLGLVLVGFGLVMEL